jgi:Helix-turn-helix of DDE superfamily endonuclease
MYHTTGLSRDRILCAMIHGETVSKEQPWPPILGLFRSVVVALTYMRRNRVQAELAETYNVSQSTVSRAITRITPLIETVLKLYVPTADELDDQTQYLHSHR